MCGNRQKYVYVILGNIPFEDFRIARLAYFTDQISDSLSNLPSQNRLAVFRDPHKVILPIINGTARIPYRKHTKSSPKGEGFSPNPRGRQ